MKKNHLLLLSLLVSLLWSGNLFAQATASGTIQGTVTDNSGAVVVGADVTILNRANGNTRNASTSGTGAFRFDLLPAGEYLVTATKGGFAKSTTSMELLVGQTATVNPQLKPGGATEVIEVSAQGTLVDQTKTSVGQNVTPSEVENLPLVGRDAANLAYLVPGVKAADSYDPNQEPLCGFGY